jgi:hypothetical protein
VILLNNFTHVRLIIHVHVCHILVTQVTRGVTDGHAILRISTQVGGRCQDSDTIYTRLKPLPNSSIFGAQQYLQAEFFLPGISLALPVPERTDAMFPTSRRGSDVDSKLGERTGCRGASIWFTHLCRTCELIRQSCLFIWEHASPGRKPYHIQRYPLTPSQPTERRAPHHT